MELALDLEEIKRYLKYDDVGLDEVTKANIDKAITLVKEIARPKYVMNYFPLTIYNNKLHLENSIISWESESLVNHLKDCHGVILLLATLGLELDKLIKKLEITDITLAYVVNGVAVEYLEKYLDYLQANEIEINGNLTSRFSIGYGDLKIDYQADLVKVLEGSKKIGVNVLETHLMVPSKSVSAIIGVSNKEVSRDLKKCTNCLANGKCSGKCITDNKASVKKG